MEILVKRTYFRDEYVIGGLLVDREYLCDTLEPHAIDWEREKKVMGKTAIPEGRYKVVMAMSKKFHREMPFLIDVPQFTGVMIHPGNKPKDTQGCILVGMNNAVGRVLKSRHYFDMLMEKINAARERKEEVWVRVVGSDPTPSLAPRRGDREVKLRVAREE